MPVKLKLAIAILMGATVFRAQKILFLSSVETFGGPASDAWFGPWLSDAILGFLVPVMVFLFWRGRSAKVWGVLVVYNGIGIFMVMQLVALALLFQGAVVSYFCQPE